MNKLLIVDKIYEKQTQMCIIVYKLHKSQKAAARSNFPLETYGKR